MANQTESKLTAPTISMTGTKVNSTASKTVTDGTWTVTAGVLEAPDSNDVSSKVFSIENGRVERFFTFDDFVDVSMTVSGQDLRSRDTTTVPSGRPVFYGDLAGVMRDSGQTDKAEIRYTVNGKDPSRTKFYRWGIDDSSTIRLQMNKTGSETVLKARTYFRGRWSDVTSVRIKIAKGTVTEENTSVLNAGNTGTPIGDPAEGQKLANDNS